jgi:peptide chain release factor 1
MDQYMLDRLEIMEKRMAAIDSQLAEGPDFSIARELNKERSTLEEAVVLYKAYKKILADLKEAEATSSDPDPEMAALGKEEATRLESEKEAQEVKLQEALLPKDANDDKNVVIEIRGAVGGDEANIFAGDLYRMYMKYADAQGWKTKVIDEEPTSLGGYSLVSFMIQGKGAYSRLKFESGAHRVQRVPVTEKSGRLQTSTATVLVMPEMKKEDVTINPSDLKIDTYRSSGAGGQNVNKTESAVRITHIPSGIVVTCQIERDQLSNKETAMELLRARLQAKMDEEKFSKIDEERKLKVGTGERSEKIRTYNYPQNRVTDHRIGFTVNTLDRVMNGDLDAILNALQEANQKDLLLQQSKGQQA